jgi:hypothetical protein
MTEFFDKLRSDRKLDEALRLIGDISDPIISSRTKAIIALNFSDASLGSAVLNALITGEVQKKDGGAATDQTTTAT